MPSERFTIYLAAFLRAVGTGLVGVVLGAYLARLELDARVAGLIVTAGLAGAAAAALFATLYGDRHGRRRLLIELSLLGAVGTVAVVLSSSPALVAAGAFVGMLNGMGRDRSAALVLEQAILPSTVLPEQRTRAIAWYNVLQDIGHAVGSLLAGVPTLLSTDPHGVAGQRGAFAAYALLMLTTALLYLRLSARIEPGTSPRGQRLSSASKRLLTRIAALFAIDSLAGGFLTTALLSYFFFERFGASELSVAALFAAARVLNALSHLAAAWLARRIGLVNTMVVTHIPSSLLLLTVAFAPSFPIAAVLFLLREGLVEMDVPTRQSYVLAVVQPEERTVASGVTHLVRLAAWAVGPILAGFLMGATSLMAPLVVGAAMKIIYDLLLWAAFRHVRPPEERGPAPSMTRWS